MKTLAGLRIGFLGGGNMAEALVKGLISSGACATADLHVTDIRGERCEALASAYGIRASSNNGAAAAEADILVLAVKPQQMREVAEGIACVRKRDAGVLSIAAGLRTGTLESWLGAGARVVRAMPNTPALVGAGVSAICPGRDATPEDMDRAEALLGATGRVVRVAEEQMDAVTATSGSGPAYVFHLMESMIEAAVELGIEPATARVLVEDTVAGAAKLVRETGLPPAELRERVTSKGGTTAAALDVIRARGVGQAWKDAMAAAKRRGDELSKG